MAREFKQETMKYDIVVLGAGVIGLSTAINIQTCLPNRHVVIIADKFTTETTSNGAAGIFRPTLEKTPAKSLEQFRKWCTDSFDWYHHLNTDHDPSKTGVLRLSGYQFTDGKIKPPFHHNIGYHFRDLTERELKSFPGDQKCGWMMSTLMVECRRYLPWLTDLFLSRGGRIENRTVSSIEEFAGKCSLLVTCCGLNAVKLLNDQEMFPVRGHLIRVKAPWVKHLYVWNSGNNYIYAGQDDVVLGGTRHEGAYDTSHNEQWFNDILTKCEKILPGIKNAEVVSKWTGLRPHRTFVRLEPEIMSFRGKKLQVVHNYGHGANGVALSWGCGKEAAQIVKDLTISKL
ncbi:hypothetical protein ACF0H5_006396 [Mactra antiquata]